MLLYTMVICICILIYVTVYIYIILLMTWENRVDLSETGT